MEAYHPAALFEHVAKMVRMPDTLWSVQEQAPSTVPPVRLRSEINPLRAMAGLPPLSVVQVEWDQIPTPIQTGLIQVVPADVPRTGDSTPNKVQQHHTMVHDGLVVGASLPTERIGETEKAKNKQRLVELSSQNGSDKENTLSTVSKGDSQTTRKHRSSHKRSGRSRDRSRDRAKRESESQISSVVDSKPNESDHERERKRSERRERKGQERREKRTEREKEKESLKSSSDEESTKICKSDESRKHSRKERKRKESRDEKDKESDATLTNEIIETVTNENTVHVKRKSSQSREPSKDRRTSSNKCKVSRQTSKISSDENDIKDKKEKPKRKSGGKQKPKSDEENNNDESIAESRDKISSTKSSHKARRERTDVKVSSEKREHPRSRSRDRKRDEKREEERKDSRNSDKASRDSKKKVVLRRTSSASTITVAMKSGRNMRALPRQSKSANSNSKRQRRQDLLHHLEAQKVQVSKSEEFKMVAQMLINDVYRRKDGKVKRLTTKHQSQHETQSHDNASLPPLSPGGYPDSNHSVYTEPIRVSGKQPSENDDRPTSALNVLYSEGSLKGYSPRSAVHSYVPHGMMGYGQRQASNGGWIVAEAITSSYEKERLLDAVRHELRHMKHRLDT